VSRDLYLRTNEHEEAVRSLEWAELQVRSVTTDPYLWKWVFIALHNAAQGFMVLALWNGNGLLTLRLKNSEKWLRAYEQGGPFPAEKLDEFLNLYAKVKDASCIGTADGGPFRPCPTSDHSLKQLNDIRNTFTHFTPMGWSLQLAGLPRICLDTLALIQHLGWDSTAIVWHKKVHLVRAKRALKRLRRTLLFIAT
jgi:hypothetical protein